MTKHCISPKCDMNKVLNEQEREMFCGASAETPQREEAELKLWKRVRSLVRDDQDEINKIADQQIQKREAELLDLWEILVPVASNGGIPFSEDHHESFRRILRGLPGNSGTTSRPAGNGDWEDKDTGKLYVEKMIPIRFRACRADAKRVADHARKFYGHRPLRLVRFVESMQ